MTDGFETYLLQQLELKRDELDEQRRRLRRVEGDVARIREMVGLYLQYRETVTSSGPLAANVTRIKGGRIADIAAGLLRDSRGRARVVDLVRQLQAMGRLNGDRRSAYGTLVKTMQRYPERFSHSAPGEFALLEDALTLTPAPGRTRDPADA
jgi:hypothetical protein